ncbi:MAG: hypothetical protein KGJ09_09725 [Candidatus Omnitrophica bacterium]|nr:hypothetical protein [Candidatus Omnitrophota bacterium]MDE2215387.1 hypothetical protein [Candidatus Omnitrophota bacterium]
MDLATVFVLGIVVGILGSAVYISYNKQPIRMIFIAGQEPHFVEFPNKNKPIVLDLDDFAKDIIEDWEKLNEDESPDEAWKRGERPYGEPG